MSDTTLRDLMDRLMLEIDGVSLLCADVPRLPQTSAYHIKGIDNLSLRSALLTAGVSVGAGVGCTLRTVKAFTDMGMSDKEAGEVITMSFDPDNTTEDMVVEAVGHIKAYVEVFRMLDGLTPATDSFMAAIEKSAEDVLK